VPFGRDSRWLPADHEPKPCHEDVVASRRTDLGAHRGGRGAVRAVVPVVTGLVRPRQRTVAAAGRHPWGRSP
jgi:hypothetical protein